MSDKCRRLKLAFVLMGLVVVSASSEKVNAGGSGYDSGLLLYQTEYPSQEFHVRDLSTRVVTDVPLPPMGNGYYNPQWCSTGEWITFVCADVIHNGQICVSRPDGSEFAQLTTGSENYVTPGFSGDCTRIVFHGVYGYTYVINRDGTGQTNLGVRLGHTRWSPVDNRIAGTDWGFTYESDIFVFDLDDATTTQITHHAPGEYFNYAYWSPDGTKLAVAGGIQGESNDIFSMNADGSDVVNLTSDWTDTDEGWPAWSDDGSFLVFTRSGAGMLNQTWAMRADGTNRVNISASTDQPEFAPALLGTPDACSQPAGETCPTDYELLSGEWLEHGPGACENTGTAPGPSLESIEVDFPASVIPGAVTTFTIDWDRCSDCNPNAVIYSSLIGDWNLDTPLYASGAYFTSCAQTARDQITFNAPTEPGSYRLRWIMCFAFDAIRNFCGEHEPGPSPDPGSCPYVEVTLTVCPPPEDSDGDGIPDPEDNCPHEANVKQLDRDADGIGDVCDNCRYRANPDQADTDHDSAGDACDNCFEKPNQDQDNCDGDTLGDVCDDDSDNDGVLDDADTCDFTPPVLRDRVFRDTGYSLLGTVLCDLDGDCDCDLLDYQLFEAMVSGPGCVSGN